MAVKLAFQARSSGEQNTKKQIMYKKSTGNTGRMNTRNTMNTSNISYMGNTGLKWRNHNRPTEKQRGDDKDFKTQEVM